MKKFFYKILFFIISFPIALLLIYLIFKPIFNAEHLLFPFAIHPFDIVSVYPKTWLLLKKGYFISFFISYFIIYNKFFNSINFNFSFKLKNKIHIENSNNDLSVFIGLNENTPVYINEKGLYQNILITGTIGTGKTSSAMYPFTRPVN